MKRVNHRQLALDLAAAATHKSNGGNLATTFGRVWFTGNGDIQVRCSTPEEVYALLRALPPRRRIR